MLKQSFFIQCRLLAFTLFIFPCTSFAAFGSMPVADTIPALDSTHFLFTPKHEKSIEVYLVNDSVVKGVVSYVDETGLSLVNPNLNSTASFQKFPISDIQAIKVKRQKFLVGLLGGGLLAGFLGYKLGSATYEDDQALSPSENDHRAFKRGMRFAFYAGIPSAVIGSIINTIVARTKFLINGKKSNMAAMGKKIW